MDRWRVKAWVTRGLSLALAGAFGAASFWLAAPVAAEPLNAGLAPMNVDNPLGGPPMSAAVFYPTPAAAETTEMGPYVMDAAQMAPVAPGRYPLVLISHGSGGTRFTHHDLASHLARQGMIVAALSHAGDSAFDHLGMAREVVLVGRVHQLLALLDGLLAHPTFAPLIDADRIGVAGASTGAYTALLAAGAKPDFGRFAEYCAAEPRDPLICKGGPALPQIRRGFEVRADKRIRAAVLMAPALNFLFDGAALAPVAIPLRLYRAGADEIVPAPFDADHIRRNLPKEPEYQVLEGTSHYAFIAPCSAALAQGVPEICRDPPAIDRAALHRRLNAEIGNFFVRAFGRP